MADPHQHKIRLKRTLHGASTPDGRVALSVSLSLHINYFRFYQEAKREASRLTAPVAIFEERVKMVVWGALCLEALLNELVGKVVRRGKIGSQLRPAKEPFSSSKWAPKLGFVTNAMEVGPARSKLLKERFKSVMDQRHRLVHYKNEMTPIDPATLPTAKGVPPGQAMAMLFPKTQIEKDLSADLMKRFDVNVRGLHRWLDTAKQWIAKGKPR